MDRDTILNILTYGIPVVMAVIGGILAAKPITEVPRGTPNYARRFWIAVFVVMGLASVALMGYQSARATAKDQAKDQEHQRELQKSEARENYLSGQVASMSQVLGQIYSNSDPSKTAAAVRAAFPPVQAYDARPAIEKLTNKDLRDRVLELVKQLRELTSQYQQNEVAAALKRAQARAPNATEAEQTAAFQQETQDDIRREQIFTQNYQTDYGANAKIYYDELIRRLGPQPVNPSEDRPLAITAGWASPLGVDETANYLDRLAHLLPN